MFVNVLLRFLDFIFLPAQYFADTSMADPQLAWDVTGPNPLMGEFYYSLSDYIWEGPAIYKHSPELVHSTMSCNKTNRTSNEQYREHSKMLQFILLIYLKEL